MLSTVISIRYMNMLPRYPDPQKQRMTPRNVSGYVIYQTQQEDRILTAVEYSSVLTFLVGLGTDLSRRRNGDSSGPSKPATIRSCPKKIHHFFPRL